MTRTGWLAVVLCMCALLHAYADTVQLKDGTVLEGEIIAEDDQRIVLEMEFAEGSIVTSRELRRADVVQVQRWSAEQRRQRAMKRDWQRLVRLQLDPQSSQPLEYYDGIISNVFEKFLADYPASEFEAEVRQRLDAWKQERDRVAAGQMKFRGEWLPAEEARRRQQIERAVAALDHARQLLHQRRYELAARQLDAVLSLTIATQQVAEARVLLRDVYQKWWMQLCRQKTELDDRIAQVTLRAEEAQRQLEQGTAPEPSPAPARSPIARARRLARPQDSNYEALGAGSEETVAAQTAAVSARVQLNQAKAELVQLEAEQRALQQTMAWVERRARIFGVALPAAKPASVTVMTKPTEAEEPSLLESIVIWFRQYWVALAAGAIVVLWVLARLTKT